MKHWLFVILALMMSGGVVAKEAAPLAADEAIEKRMELISEELRCLVCQNESLAASRSELAQDLRREVRALIAEGKTDSEIRKFMVDRYGDFVLYRPPVKPTTWLLWGGPFLLLGGGVIALIVFLRRRNAQLAAGSLSDADRQRAAALLNASPTEEKNS